jgi:hypothetical protein
MGLEMDGAGVGRAGQEEDFLIFLLTRVRLKKLRQ